jgi:hypothetical protein
MASETDWLTKYPKVNQESWLDKYPKVTEKPFFDLSDTLSATGRAFTSLGTSVPASMRQAFGGLENPWQRSESYTQSRADMQALQEELNASEAAAMEGGDASSVSSSIREATPSLGFSGSTLVPSLAAGAVTALATKSPVAARSAAAGTSLLMAYRMAGAQFLDDSRERIDNFFQEKLQRPLTPEEQNEAYEELLPLARKFGAAEAGPEALGNMALGGAGKYIRKALGGKNGIMSLASNALSKVTGAKAVGAGIGAAAGEVVTEAITAVEQDRINKEFEQSILRGEAPESVVLPDRTVQDYTKGITEVAPTTLAMTGLMGLAGLGPTAINRGYRALRPQAEQQAVETEITTEEPAPAPLAPEPPSQIIPKELVVKANETSPDVSSSTTAFVELNENLLKTQAEGAAAKAAQMLAQEQVAQAQAAAELQAQLEAPTTEQPLAQEPQAPVGLPVPTVAPTVETPSPAMEQLEKPSQTITDSNGEIAPEMSVLPPTVQAGAGVGEAPITEETVLPAQPATPLENAPLEITDEESLLQEPQGRVESREAAEASLGNQLLSPAPSQEEVAPPLPPTQETPTPATEGTVMPGGSAIERDVTKPEQMTPEEFTRRAVGPKFADSVALGAEEKWWDTKKAQKAPIKYAAGTKMAEEKNGKFLVLDTTTNKFRTFGGKREAMLFFKAKEGASQRRYIETLEGKTLSGIDRIGSVLAIEKAFEDNNPVSSISVDTYGITLPEGYVKQGDLYVFSPQTTTVATPTETAAPLAKEAAVASVVQQPAEGSIPAVEQESATTAIESNEKADIADAAMAFLEEDLTESKRQWSPEKIAAAKAYFASGGKDMDVLRAAFPKLVGSRPIVQAYLKADKEASEAKAKRDAADAKLAKEVERDEKEQAKAEAEQKKRDELGLKTLNSLIQKTRTNVVQGTVNPTDANQAVAILNRSGEIPNVLFTWIGTSKDFLADPANRARYPETWAAVSANSKIEGMSENGQPIVFTDNVGVSDLDRKLANLQGTTPEVAAVRRVILHENIHKGMFFLSMKEKMQIFSFLRRMYSPQELDSLAESYSEYSDWRTNQVSYFSILEEAMTRDFDSMVEIPRDGILAEFMQFLRGIWQKITGKTSEPTLKDYKDVFRLIRNSLKNSEKANADMLVNGGGVRMSMSEFLSNVTPEQDAEYMAAVEAGDVAKQQAMVDAAAKAAGYNSPKLYHGTGAEFSIFDKKRGGSRTNAKSAQIAFFFTDDEATAKAYAVYAAEDGPVKDALKKAELAEKRGDWDGYDAAIQEAESLDNYEAALKRRESAKVVSTYLRGDFLEFDAKGQTPQELSDVDIDKGITSQLRKAQRAGKTGVLFKNLDDAVNLSNRPSNHYAVFDPNQIKSADPVTRDEQGNVIQLSRRFQTASNDIRFSKVEYDSPNDAAFNSGAEVARNTDYDERDKEVRSTIRAAYDIAPKTNGPSVTLDELFSIVKQSMPDLTETEFSRILQGLYEDSGALLIEGESPFATFTTEGERAGSVIVMPPSGFQTRAMASMIDPEDAATKQFAKNIKDINSGTAKAAFDGVQFVDFEPVDHIVKPNKSYEQVAIDYVNSFIAEGGTLEQMANSVISPDFLASIGIEDDVKARQALVAEVKNRIVNTRSKKKSKVEKKFFERLNNRVSSFWQGLGTKSGGNQGQRAYIIGNPRYSWMFLSDEVEKDLKERRDNILTVQFGNDNATSFTQNSYENADKANQQAVDEMAQDAVNNDEWALIKEGEQVFEGGDKTLWERAKALVRRFAFYARAEAAEKVSASKASITDAERNELNAILTMPKAEREKAKAKDLAEFRSIMGKLLGDESPTDTPTEKKKRKKRKEIIDTVEKRVAEGQPIEPTAEEIANEIEIAENKASQIVYRFEELYRQGFKNPPEGMSKKEQKDSIIRAFRDQVKNPVSFEQFAERLDALKVGEEVSERLFLTASRERADLARMKKFKIEKRRVEIADKQASRLIYSTEERLRQGSKDLSKSTSGDSINKAFKDQVSDPVDKSKFAERLAKLDVSPDVAERLFKTAEREKTDLEAMAAFNILQGPKALQRMINEINNMRRGEEIPLRTPIPWRQLLSQSAKTVEEYRQRILDAISANESLKNATPEQKARLAELFTEAWETKRKRILDSMQERLIREQEAKGNLSKKAAKALQENRMRIVEDINLGIFDNDEIAKIIAEKFGIKSEFTDEERRKIESLIAILQDETLNRVKRNKAAYELLETLSAQTDISIAKLLANFWVSSVLSGMNTVFSIGMSVFSGMGELTTALSRIFSAAFSNPKQLSSEVAAAFKTLARVISAVPRQANRAWQYLVTGDQAFLDPSMNDALKNMDYASIGKNNQLSEQMAKSDKILEKSMGLFMRTVSRLLTALDLFNSGLTKEGSLSIVFRQLDLDPAKIQMLEKKSDLKAYKDQVIRDYFNNVQPKTLNEKALVESYAMAEMMKALDEIGNVSENADQMAMQGAMTLDPSGLGGYGYRFVKSMMKSAESGTDKLLERNLRKWDEAVGVDEKAEAGVRLVLSYIFQFAAYNAANLVGVRFARFAGNKFNQSLSFLPLIGALRLYEKEFDSDRIRGKEAFTDMIKRNQLTGVIAAVIGYYVLKAIAEEPDDEKRGAFINGGWSNLTPEKKQQKLASGQKEYTLGFGDTVINYGNWPGSGILASIGGLSDLIRFSPDQWNDKTVANKLLSATTSGVFSAMEVPALSQFQELFGSSLSSKDPNEQKLTKFARVIGNYVGGFVPRILKDIDYLSDPNFRKYETLWEKTASHIPVYRRYEGKEYYDILGQQIQRNVYPGSREFMTKPTDPAYRVLGALNSRGIWLTPANAEHRMVGKGARRRSLTQEEADNYSLETGKGYKQMLLRYGQRALQMPTERAKAFLLDKADDVRDRALKKVYRGYKPAT